LAPVGLNSSQAPVGLDVGTNYVRAATIKPSGAGFSLSGYGRAPMPFGAVVEGEIVDPEAVAGALKNLWRTSGFKSKEVAVGVANQKVVVRLIDLPYMQKDELDGAIQYQAQDYIPIPIEEAILSYDIIGDYMTPSDEHMMEVLLVAAQRDMIDNTVAAVDSAGLKLVRIDVSSFALVRALLGFGDALLPEEGEGATGIIHITSGYTNIAVVEKGFPRFTRVSSMAGNEFTQAIASVLNTTYDDAEALKIELGLPSLDGLPTLSARHTPEVVQTAQHALEREANKFIAEVRRSLDYYLTQATNVRSIRRIILSGSGSMMKNLPNYIEKGLQTEVILGDPLGRIQIPSSHESALLQDRMGCTAAIGLALGGAA
jgi:type IV pilus assembly protein PilM